jgi:hypothetical protein
VLKRKVYYAHGVDSRTWKQVLVDTRRGNQYLFNEVIADDRGDGTVHSRSGIRSEIPKRRTYIDRRQKVSDFLAGQHANMPNHSGLQDWVLGVLHVNPFAEDTFESPF